MVGPFAYIGGKRLLAPQVLALVPKHLTYVEPFCGGAQVFFRKPPSTVEVLNDLDSELVTFLRVCQLHHDELLRWLAFAVTSRQLTDLYRRQDPTTIEVGELPAGNGKREPPEQLVVVQLADPEECHEFAVEIVEDFDRAWRLPKEDLGATAERLDICQMFGHEC